MLDLDYKAFAERLITAMKQKGFYASRSPHGICMKTLAQFADASEQICRRYIRAEALPSYEKIIQIANHLEISPAWLLFGEEPKSHNTCNIAPEVLHKILSKSHALYKEEHGQTDEFADFVMSLMHDISQIDTSKDNLHKIIDLAVSSISSFKQRTHKKIS